MEPFMLNDTEWTADEVEKHRELIIELRDSALKHNNFTWSVVLSITVGLLHHLAEELKKDE